MSKDEERNNKLSDKEKDLLKLPEADTLGGMALKSMSEQNVSNLRKVSEQFNDRRSGGACKLSYMQYLWFCPFSAIFGATYCTRDRLRKQFNYSARLASLGTIENNSTMHFIGTVKHVAIVVHFSLFPKP